MQRQKLLDYSARNRQKLKGNSPGNKNRYWMKLSIKQILLSTRQADTEEYHSGIIIMDKNWRKPLHETETETEGNSTHNIGRNWMTTPYEIETETEGYR